jgi:3-oxoacyl-[acyl-carrier-protein] synthase II
LKRRVVITGTGAVTPLGLGSRALIERWVEGTSGIEDGLGRCSEFDPSEVLTVKEVRRSDRFTQFAIAACAEALESAGWADGLPYASDRVGCVVGTGIGGLATIEEQHSRLLDAGERSVSALGVPMMMSNAAAGALAMRHGMTGPSWGVVSACAAGAHAIGTAVRLVQTGDADAVVTGGAEAALTPMARAGFARMGATSPTGVSRPFDARRDGFVLGEGAGILVLEEREAALARGAQPIGEVLGYCATADAYHLTAPQPTGECAARAIAGALAEAGLDAARVDYVNAHGTSTPLNDRTETQALKSALGDRAATVPVSSLKSAIGHLLGASGAVEAIATALALRERVAPPTLNWSEPEEGLDLDYVPGVARPLRERANGGGDADGGAAVGISNSFGFGGHNAVICLAGGER